MTNDYTDSPEAIKTDIERTRQNMSDKIDQIQARLSPTNIKAQAQETVRDIVRDSTESLTAYLSENSRELGSSVAHTIKSNPIPAALIGLGIGWLLVESAGGGRSKSQQNNWQHSDSQRNQWYPEAESRYASSMASGPYSTREMSAFSSQYQGAGAAYPSSGAPYQGSGAQYQDAASQYRTPQGNTSDYGRYTSSDQSGGKASDIREQIGEKAEQLREGVQQVGEQVREQVGEWTDRFRSQSSSASDQAGYYAGQARAQASQVGEQAQFYVQQTGQQLQRSLEENPLLFGGVALAVGALIGIALPETRRENQMMGPWRDEVVSSAQEVANEAIERAKQVAEEVRPQFEETAQKVVSDLKQSGQSALADVKQTGREALEEVKQTGREALEETKQTGKDAAANAQQAVKDTAEKAKQEAHHVGEKVRTDTQKMR